MLNIQTFYFGFQKKMYCNYVCFFVFPEILYPGDDERNRQRYFGQLNNGIPNGQGTMACKDGQTYKGTK